MDGLKVVEVRFKISRGEGFQLQRDGLKAETYVRLLLWSRGVKAPRPTVIHFVVHLKVLKLIRGESIHFMFRQSVPNLVVNIHVAFFFPLIHALRLLGNPPGCGMI